MAFVYVCTQPPVLVASTLLVHATVAESALLATLCQYSQSGSYHHCLCIYTKTTKFRNL